MNYDNEWVCARLTVRQHPQRTEVIHARADRQGLRSQNGTLLVRWDSPVIKISNVRRLPNGTPSPSRLGVPYKVLPKLGFLARKWFAPAAADLPVQGERPICVRCGGWADDPNVMHHPTKGCYGMPPLLPVQGEPGA